MSRILRNESAYEADLRRVAEGQARIEDQLVSDAKLYDGLVRLIESDISTVGDISPFAQWDIAQMHCRDAHWRVHEKLPKQIDDLLRANATIIEDGPQDEMTAKKLGFVNERVQKLQEQLDYWTVRLRAALFVHHRFVDAVQQQDDYIGRWFNREAKKEWTPEKTVSGPTRTYDADQLRAFMKARGITATVEVKKPATKKAKNEKPAFDDPIPPLT